MEINDALTGIFREVFDDDSIELRPEMTADDVDGWDSLSHVNLIVAVERFYKIKFGFGETQTLKNVGDLMALILKKTAK